ncbi:MAG TPA: HAMP domain-containing sensor histidine kinase [Pilimelia sp.]|nr:HAMP domain-containing sensor histidine kinase [Pilimelia sp.]
MTAVLAYANRLLDLLPRPLDPVRSIKLKLGLLLVSSGAAGLVVFRLGIGWIPPATSLTAVLVALATSQVLAHGMTSPLREMTAAARAMARGDYSRRVHASSRDEVGELARAFNSMAADLATADRQRRELIANVSHEVRTPITALRGLLENIVDGVAEADPAALRTALAQTERLARLVTELLDLSRLDAGAAPMDVVDMPLGPFLQQAVREAEVSAAGAGRRVRFALQPPAIPLVIRADPTRLHQVLANLLDNGARHSPPDGLVEVTAGAEADGVVIDVSDQGPGIPPDERAAVFERFTRGQRASGRDGGTGLGLAIARWVVTLHHGSLTAGDPPSGQGCRMRITLPHPEAADVPATQPAWGG